MNSRTFNSRIFKHFTIKHILEKNNMKALLFRHKYYNDLPNKYDIDIAAERGYLNIIKWAYKIGICISSSTMNWAVQEGHVHILDWGIKRTNEKKISIVPDLFSMNYAARNGHLDVLKWGSKIPLSIGGPILAGYWGVRWAKENQNEIDFWFNSEGLYQRQLEGFDKSK